MATEQTSTEQQQQQKRQQQQQQRQQQEQQVQTIVSQLSLDDKLKLISGASLWTLASDVLAPHFNWNRAKKDGKLLPSPCFRLSDGPHGLRKTLHEKSLASHPSTCFPTGSALAATWNSELLEQQMGHALAKECEHHKVNVVLGPAMNIQRHPCCGRTFEYLSEDPCVSGRIASAIVRGIQSTGKAGACIKHMCVNHQEHRRFVVSSTIDQRTLREIYLKGFEIVMRGDHTITSITSTSTTASITQTSNDKPTNKQHNYQHQHQPWAIMCAYNKLNGMYCSEHKHLFQDIIRNEWLFQGAVMTDWGATNDRVKGIQAGIDLEMPGSKGVHDAFVREALHSGQLVNEELDQCVARIVNLHIQAFMNNNQGTNQVVVDEHKMLDEHHQIAYQVALEAPVLLKNVGLDSGQHTGPPLLPLKKDSTSLAVIGGFAKFPRIQGMGSSQVNPHTVESIWDYLTAESTPYCTNIQYADGYDVDDPGVNIDQQQIDEATRLASNTERVLLLVGQPEICESEAYDRPNLDLPTHHQALVEAVLDANSNVIIVLVCGGPVTMTPWISKARAVIQGFLLGQAGGKALVDLVFGKHSFSGKLPMTFPTKAAFESLQMYTDFPGHDRVEYREGLHVGYRHFASREHTTSSHVQFPFGHGLSYSTFEYTNMAATIEVDKDDEKRVEVSFQLQNTGTVRAAEVWQIYLQRTRDATVDHPDLELKHFGKIMLEPGQQTTISFTMHTDCFTFWDVGHEHWTVEPGRYSIMVAASVQDVKLSRDIEFKSGRPASTEARMAHPPSILSNSGNESISTSKFAQMLGPQQEHLIESDSDVNSKREFHRNSLLYEIAEETWTGYIFATIVYLLVSVNLGVWKDPKLGEVAKAMTDNMPLRGIVLFSDGALSFMVIDVLVDLLNGNWSGILQKVTRR